MKAIVLHSGGLDSTVLLASVIHEAKADEVQALHINYGQRHNIELDYASQLCRFYNVPELTVSISAPDYQRSTNVTWLRSSQTDAGIEVPEGHYTDESMRVTVVPNRNMMMLAVAIGWADSLRYDHVYFAAHAGDHAIYPDCRSDFIVSLADAAERATEGRVVIKAPFLYKSKTDIVKHGARLHVPFHLTYSCYKGKSGEHCGKCGTCVERREAFEDARVVDPTTYDADLWTPEPMHPYEGPDDEVPF